MKKLLSLLLAALFALGMCFSATAATFDGTGNLADVIAQAQPKSEENPTADDVVELTRDSYLYADAILKAGTTLVGSTASRELTVDNAVLTVENGARIADLSIRLKGSSILRVYGGADLSGLKGLTKDSGAAVQYVYVNAGDHNGYSAASSFISAPQVKGATVANVPDAGGNPTGEFAASVQKGSKVEVTLTANQHLPAGAALLLGDVAGT